jgi:hypothetical protein
MKPILAHQGGWDEMLVAAGLVLAVMGAGRLRRRRGERRSGGRTPHRDGVDRCAYCDEPLPEGAERCPACGFRVAGGAAP